MSLFQKSVEKKYLNDLDSVLIDKKYADFQDYFGNVEIQGNIRNLKEEEFQSEFIRELFVNIFDYTLKPKPDFNIVLEKKNVNDSKKADGAILKGDNAHAVIELKSTNTTDLDSIETQAFGYKNHHPKCVYVITSNFEKLRFYIQNAVDHIDFDLFKLTREQFSLLWLCLAKENLINDLPLKIKNSSVLQEADITKKLYADYSKFRGAIYNNLVKNNPDTDKLLLFKKTQKLLDRFLFIFFAEDRLLVPPNSISQIIEKWKDDVDFGDNKPLYSIFKKYFHVLNVGRPKSGKRQEIFAYNGGLFAPDEILDNITIDDDILHEHTLRLSNYDFETDVDVNILGHIFEHSLGEIAAIAATRGLIPLTNTRVISKRKKDGIFYTPKYITKYIVENTVGRLCKEKRTELHIVDEEYAKGRKNRKKDIVRTLDKKLDEYRNWLLTLTILDPACGSGAFLNQALEYLINEHRKIDELRVQLLGGAIIFSDITTDILEKNIYGVDLNEESVDIAKLSLWLRTAQKGRKLNTLSNNIKCGNSLIDDPEVAGDKAFNWQNEFPQIFRKKKKEAWHVTTAIHNSRYSQRMFDYHIKTGDANRLSENDEIIITEIVAGIVKEDKLNVIEYNICGDHMHLLLVCEREELTKIVGKIKAKSGRKYNIEHGITKVATSATTRGHVPLSSGNGSSSGRYIPSKNIEDDTEKKKYNSLWTQKFGKSEIKSGGYLDNAIEYIRNNRIKHDLPKSEKIEKIKEEFLCTKEHAFRTEYSGGFDVVIGNPPYVQVNEYQKYYSCNYQTSACNDLYVYFIEKGISLLRKKGIFSFITPSLYIKGLRYETLREFLLKEVDIIEILDKGDGVFQEVQMPTAILTLVNAKETKQNWNEFISGYSIISKLEQSSLNISDFSKIKRGLEIGKDKVYKNGNGIEILTGENISRYFIKDKSLIPDETYSKYKKDEYYFNGNRVVIRETGNRLTAIFINENIQQNRSLYSIKIEDEKISYLFLLSLINSKLIQYYYKAKFAANTDIFPKIRIAQVKNIPIKEISKDHQQPFIEKANKMLSLNKQLQEKKTIFLNRVKDNLGATAPTRGHIPLAKAGHVPEAEVLSAMAISKKLEAFYNCDFKTFVVELKKQKIKLSLIRQDEWEKYFNAYKSEINQLQSEIEKTDKEIDQMVYELYGLAEEEIKIVEGA